jgi:hypothetical protein
LSRSRAKTLSSSVVFEKMKKILLITISLIALALTFCLLPDPSVEWHEFSDSLRGVGRDDGFELVEIRTESGPGPSVERNIPLLVRYHPRRRVSKRWRGDFIGLSAGQHAYVFRKGDTRLTLHTYSIRKRTCAVDIDCGLKERGVADQLANSVKEMYARLPIRIREKTGNTTNASTATNQSAPLRVTD